MTEEEAVEELKFEIDNKMIRRTIFTNQAIKVVLKELDKKDRVIDEMAEDIYDYELAILEDNQRGYGFDNIEEVKQYFYKKVEEQE